MKATVCIRAAVFLFLVAGAAGLGADTPVREVASAGELQGDVNCSGAADSIDSLQILRSVAGLSTSAACLAEAGDVNCDAAVNSIDALRILRHVAGLSNTVPDGCAPIGQQISGGPSSHELIQQALADGEIDEEAALLYEVFASHGDTRLPERYRGVPAEDSDALRRAAIDLNALSPETQAALEPFYIPPYAPGSWLGLDTVAGAGGVASQSASDVTWTTFTAAGGAVKVWAQDRYPGDAEKAQAIAAQYTQSIWPELLGLMGQNHTPLADAGPGINIANNGGDAALDVYLVHMANNGEFKNHKESGSCQLVRGYITLNSARPIGSETSAGIIQSAAHETMHAIQATYQLNTGCWTPEYAWFEEASPKWSEDYVYPKAQSEQPYAPSLLDEPEISLDHYNGQHQYGAYVFPFYLVRTGGEGVIPAIWQAFASHTSLEAINSVIQPAGGLEDVFPDFANYNWNREPMDDYKQWDKLSHGAKPFLDDPRQVGIEKFEMSLDLPYLAAEYRRITFKDNVKSVIFKNTIAEEAIPHAHVWGIAKINGEWKDPEDWTEEIKRIWCRDSPDENIQELVLVFTNTDWQGKQNVKPAGKSSVEGKALGCTDWVGTASAEVFYFDATFTITVSGLRFELNEPIPQGRYVAYKLTRSPVATWRVSGTWPGGCTASGEMPLQPADGTIGDNLVYGALVIDREEDDYQGVINGHNFDAVITVTCPGGSGEIGWPVISIMNTGLPDPKITEDGLLDGEYLDPSETYGGRWSWHFDPAPPE